MEPTRQQEHVGGSVGKMRMYLLPSVDDVLVGHEPTPR